MAGAWSGGALRAGGGGGRAEKSGDVYRGPLEPITIDLEADRIDRVLGVEVELGEAAGILERLGFAVERKDRRLRARPPLFRLDCSIPEDLIEEVGRIYGY